MENRPVSVGRKRGAARVRIADVARHAGVGVGTVSRVLNGGHRVSDATRKRVLEVIQELDYQPSPLARNLSLGRTQALVVVVPFVTNPSAVQRLSGFLRRIGTSPYDVVLFDVERPERRDATLHRLTRRGLAEGGVIVSLRPDDALAAAVVASGIPIVLLDAEHPQLPSLSIDNVEGGRVAARYLLELGHRCIAFVGDTVQDQFGFTSSADRRAGYLQALADADGVVDPAYVKEGPHGRHVAHRLTNELLALPEPPTAVFAASDTQALGVIEAVTVAGLDVPGDISVVGFDDIEVAAYVGLTTVRQPLDESGEMAAEMLLQALAAGTADAVQVKLPLDLVARRTTRPLA
jgi:LacI family transcriptional regulator